MRNLRGMVNWILVLVMVLTLAGCGGNGCNPFKPNKPESVVAPSTPAPSPAPVVVAPVVKPKKIVKPVILVDRASGTWGLNKRGMDMLKSGRYVVHLQYGYVYDICKIEKGKEVRESNLWYPKFDKVTIGMYDTLTGKYVCSAVVKK